MVPAYLPATHSGQTLAPALGPKVPVVHGWHAAAEDAPAPALNLPASQLEHVPESPMMVLYSPAPQFRHALRPVAVA